ncbi:helix-turn-helix domain-containing protein [uncultured Sphingomonas sp.]|uniref:helix-turn-helix domain-containing protein n=1 Tax=uncultured Sphingomonas sp. TaxID=158754 RepID=UPI002586E56E|nr:helix-turn-helix domain-containing protein [uncultured Sphingomonas sp.]
MPSTETKLSRAELAPAPLEPLAVRIPTAMQLIGVRRSTVYALIKAGELRTVKLGRATLITMISLRQLVER